MRRIKANPEWGFFVVETRDGMLRLAQGPTWVLVRDAARVLFKHELLDVVKVASVLQSVEIEFTVNDKGQVTRSK